MKITQDQQVEFDEFSRACDLVEGYFGETVDDVALHAPVSRRQLVAVLARAQLSGRQLAIEGLSEKGEVVFQSNDETVLWLESGFWATVEDRHGLEIEERRAARAVHRRLLEAITGERASAASNRTEEPFVLVERFGRDG